MRTTVEHQSGTGPDIVNNALFTEPFVFVPYGKLLIALEKSHDNGATSGVIASILHRIREHYGKRVLSVFNEKGAVWIPENTHEHTVTLKGFRPIPAHVTHLTETQRAACEAIWPLTRRAHVSSSHMNGKPYEGITLSLPDASYDRLVTVASALVTQRQDGVGWEDIYPPNGDDYSDDYERHQEKMLAYSMHRLNDFLKREQSGYRLKPIKTIPYRYAFQPVAEQIIL